MTPGPAAPATPFGVYVHVPFCAVRCGYCDFNTYTAEDLGEGASQREYAATAIREMEMAVQQVDTPAAHTVFFGGGTPTRLPTTDLVRMLAGVRDTFGIEPDAEVTCEANPDSVTQNDIAALREGGFTRMSFGMQSACPHVLATLERTHDPERVGHVVQWAREAGLEVSLDLIYGTPGESLADWRQSIETALDYEVDHLSCYALTVEPHTKMGRAIAHGRLEPPDDDDEARKYELADALCSARGLPWYEISNFARPGHESHHNLGYWRQGDWWGIGPGAHSAYARWPHDGKPIRFWNVKHPRAYADKVRSGTLPWAGEDHPDRAAMELEKIMLGLRLSQGLPQSALANGGHTPNLDALVAQGLLDPEAMEHGVLRLTIHGRLLMDTVTMRLIA